MELCIAFIIGAALGIAATWIYKGKAVKAIQEEKAVAIDAMNGAIKKVQDLTKET